VDRNTQSLVLSYFEIYLYIYDLSMFIRYLVSITQVLKGTSFGLHNWCECGNLLFYIVVLCSCPHQHTSVGIFHNLELQWPVMYK
jgi:hypothetical protein